MSDVLKTAVVRSRIPAQYLELDWADFDAAAESRAKVVHLLQEWLKNPEGIPGFYFYGEFGVGKSMLAALLLRDLIARKKRVTWATPADLTRWMHAAWYNEPEGVMFERAKSCAGLAIDEFLPRVRRISSAMKDAVTEVIRARTVKKLTILTSNDYFEKIGEVYGEGLMSYLKELVLPVRVEGGDFREEIKQRIQKQAYRKVGDEA